jgi:hypothetical protein
MQHEFTSVGRIAYFSMEIAIGKNAAVFNTHRMIRRYATEAYML